LEQAGKPLKDDSPGFKDDATMSAEDSLKAVRLEKGLQMLREGVSPYPSGFRPDRSCTDLIASFRDVPGEALDRGMDPVALAGRILSLRDFGKSCFAHLQDETGSLQLYFQTDTLGATHYASFKAWADIGDIVGVTGGLFRTRTGELTLRVESWRMLSKAVRTLPEKFHGLKDVELRYRKRYLDLVANPAVREVFRTRARVIRLIREFFDARGFLEVETPMMHPIPGGAAARPFTTHHQALGQTLYLRIAPELYLKRLLVGGVGKVYELNKNFRNEGLSSRHNPEFTMIEFYEAYADYEAFMALTETLVCELVRALRGTLILPHQGLELDFTPPWRRLSLVRSLQEVAGFSAADLQEQSRLVTLCHRAGVQDPDRKSRGELLAELFEETVEAHLQQPTFVTHYPVEVSPLARSSEAREGFVDRFELFVGGREVANGFSELNDPGEQRRRFEQQLARREHGDETAQRLDEDFLEALEFGMPPAAGEGIGIDRLVMILTDSPSIRDVILFPQMRPETRSP